MKKATHNGTCQACGRNQAVNYKSGLLAKHGYTVDYGYFSGQCSGSDKKPLQNEKEHNIEVISNMLEWAKGQEEKANQPINSLNVEVADYSKTKFSGFKQPTKLVKMNKSEWIEHMAANYSTTYKANDKGFEKEVGVVKGSLISAAKFVRRDAELLEQLRKQVFGTDLLKRENEENKIKEAFYDKPNHNLARHQAYARQEELKAQGISSRVSTPKYNRGGTATLTYKI